MKDMRSLKTVVAETGDIGEPEVRGYLRRGYGLIQIPDLSALSDDYRNLFLGVIADQVQEFLEDEEEVMLLRRRGDRWSGSLLHILARRKVFPATVGDPDQRLRAWRPGSAKGGAKSQRRR